MSGMIVVNGAKPLCGTVRVPAAKNSVLPIMAASLLCEGEVKLGDVPRLADVECCAALLQSAGRTVSRWGDCIVIDGSACRSALPPQAADMRASVLFLAPLLVRLGHAEAPLPGGCRIGARRDFEQKGRDSMSFVLSHISDEVGIALLVIIIVWYLLVVVAKWKIFAKMGAAGWKSLIPIYNLYVQYGFTWQKKMALWLYALQIVGSALADSGYRALDLISLACGIVSWVICCVGCGKLARSFGKGALFTVGLIVFDPIFELILGYGSSEYIGNMSAETE